MIRVTLACRLATLAVMAMLTAGCGADAAPYFRVFNPVLQGQKFDPKGVYVRKWIPELTALPNKLIHEPWEADVFELAEANMDSNKAYLAPIVDHSRARDRALRAYEQIKKTARS